MSNVPSYIRNFLDQFAQSGSLASTPGFQVMCALRKKLLATNDSLSGPDHPHYLSIAQAELLSTRVSLEISTPLDDGDIDYLAERLTQSYLQVRDGFVEGGYVDPIAVTLDMMSKFSVKF